MILSFIYSTLLGPLLSFMTLLLLSIWDLQLPVQELLLQPIFSKVRGSASNTNKNTEFYSPEQKIIPAQSTRHELGTGTRNLLQLVLLVLMLTLVQSERRRSDMGQSCHN